MSSGTICANLLHYCHRLVTPGARGPDALVLYLSPTPARHHHHDSPCCITNNRYVGRYLTGDGQSREAGKINVQTSKAGDAETVNNFWGHSGGRQTENLQILVFPEHQLLLRKDQDLDERGIIDRGIAPSLGREFKVLSLNIWNEGMGNSISRFTDSEERIALAILDAKIENGLVGLSEVGGTNCVFLTHDLKIWKPVYERINGPAVATGSLCSPGFNYRSRAKMHQHT